MPDSTSANGHPSTPAIAPSVEGRSPTITPWSPSRRRTMAAAGGFGLPATSGVRPDAVATAATIAPAPGSTWPAPGYVGSALVATKRAPSRTASRGPVEPSKSNVRCQPTTTASAGTSSTTAKPAPSSASTTPAPAHARTDEPGASDAPEELRGGLRAREHLVGLGARSRTGRTSRGSPRSAGSSCWSGTRRARRRRAAPAPRRPSPGSARRRARGRRRDRGRRRSLGDERQCVAVGSSIRPHDRGELEVAAGAVGVAARASRTCRCRSARSRSPGRARRPWRTPPRPRGTGGPRSRPGPAPRGSSPARARGPGRAPATRSPPARVPLQSRSCPSWNRSYASFIVHRARIADPSRSFTWEPNTPLPEFLPFRGLRYRHDDLAAVTAPPYDVIDPDERAVLLARSPHNAVRLLLPDGDYDGAARDLAALAGRRHARARPRARVLRLPDGRSPTTTARTAARTASSAR